MNTGIFELAWTRSQYSCEHIGPYGFYAAFLGVSVEEISRESLAITIQQLHQAILLTWSVAVAANDIKWGAKPKHHSGEALYSTRPLH